MTNTLLYVTLLIFGTPYVTQCELYYITPSSNEPCPTEPCLTLSQFAATVPRGFLDPNTTMTFLDQNITMAFLPGNHTLDTKLEAKDIKYFKMEVFANKPTKFTTDTYIICKQNSMFAFDAIDEVDIAGIHFVVCGGNNFKSIKMLTLENCQFHKAESTAIELYRTNAKILSAAFILNSNSMIKIHSDDVYDVIYTRPTEGGAITTDQLCNVSITNSSFKGNRADLGGALFINGSSIDISNSSFVDNHATQQLLSRYIYGGVIFTVNSTIHIRHVQFHNNEANGGGGVIWAQKSKIISTDSHFNNNKAQREGGVFQLYLSTVNSTNDHFYSNNGGVMSMINSTVNCNYGSFYNNTILNYGRGGVINAEFSNIRSQNNHFYGNSAGFGGVMHVFFSRIDSKEDHFYNNHAFSDGGVMWANNSTINSTSGHYRNNSAYWNGGIIFGFYSEISSRYARYHNNKCAYFGGVLVLYQSTINSTFDDYTENIASEGGVMILEHSTTNINNDNFTNNSAGREGGVISAWNSLINSYADYFTNNGALVDGGVIIALGYSTINSSDDYFFDNRAGNDGGVFLTINSTIKCYGDIFINNHANRDGGVLCILYRSMTNFYSDHYINNRDAGIVTINSTNDYFSANSAGRDGGVAYCSTLSSITVANITADSNMAGRDGGVFNIELGRIQIYKGSFNRSSAKRGGVISANEIQIILKDNTFFDTRAEIGSVFHMCGSDLRTGGDITLLQNKAAKAVAYFVDSIVLMSGNTTLSDNIGSIVAILSNVTFTNYVTVMSGKVSKSPVPLSKFEEGGAITAIQSNVVFDGECRLCDNQARIGGAIRSVKSTISVYGKVMIENNTATESGGGAHLYQSELTCQLQSVVQFFGNIASTNGGGICAISSTVNLKSNAHERESNSVRMQLIDNRAELGGGVYLQMNSVIYIRKYAVSTEPYPVLNFTNNTADFGGAVFIPDNTEFGVCTEFENSTYSISNECPIQVQSLYGATVINNKEETVSSQNIYFLGSTAEISGSSMYGSFMDRCIVNHLAEGNITYDIDINSPFEEMQVYETSYLQDVSNIKTSEIGTPPAKVCFCKDNTPNCTYQHPPIFTERGETVVVSLAVLDEVDNVVRDAEVFGYLRKNGSGICKHEQDGHMIMNGTCNDFTFRAYSIHASDELILHTEPGPCQYSTPQQIQLTLQFPWCENCPIGFQRFDDQELGCRCDCHSDIQDFFTNCDSRNQTLQKTSSVWISYINDTAKSMIGFIIHPHCPLDYCTPTDSASVYINFNEDKGADAQCAYNRSGTLCGTCPPNLSLSLGSSKCLSCPKLWPILTVVIILSSLLSGIALVALMLFLNLTVAVGTINAIIFYAHIVAANSKILLPFSQPNFATVLISWLNLEFGLDVCFFKGMDIYWKTWLQLAFPTYIIFLVAMVIIYSEQSMRFAHVIGKRNPIATLTTLILLSYAKFLHTVIAAFSFSTLEYPDGSRQTVWLPDGTVSYFSGKHIALFIAAVFILILGIVYTGLLFSWQWLLRYQHKKIFKWARNQKLCQFLEPYHAPYNFKHRYWTGLLLLIRVVLYTVSATNVSGDPRVVLVSTICLVGILPLLRGFLAIRIYKSTPVDVMEMFTYINLILLSIFSWYGLETDNQLRAAVAYTSVSITFVLLLVVLLCHVYKYTNTSSKLQESEYFTKLLVILQINRNKQPNIHIENNKPSELKKELKKVDKPTFTVVEMHQPQLLKPHPNVEEFTSNPISAPLTETSTNESGTERSVAMCDTGTNKVIPEAHVEACDCAQNEYMHV